MTESLQIATRTEEARVPVTVLEVAGDIDFASYESLLRSAEDAMQSGARYLLIDLTQVPYVASAGLRAIHAILNRFNGAAVQDGLPPVPGVKSPYVKLLNPTPEISRTLSVTGFDMFLDVFSDRQAAIDSY
jgi:anti-anti-sigma factor